MARADGGVPVPCHGADALPAAAAARPWIQLFVLCQPSPRIVPALQGAARACPRRSLGGKMMLPSTGVAEKYEGACNRLTDGDEDTTGV
jgi:hypothetical protein